MEDYGMMVCTVCGYDTPCITNREEWTDCPEAEWKPMFVDIPSHRISLNLNGVIRILLEIQEEVESEDDPDDCGNSMTVPDEPYEFARDMEMEREDRL
ncbi:MAG: hypothetical protein EOM68_22010 [Spirochaetia bacterium]|nr:hypothetical protein [Spirochaetia bacterium]